MVRVECPKNSRILHDDVVNSDQSDGNEPDDNDGRKAVADSVRSESLDTEQSEQDDAGD